MFSVPSGDKQELVSFANDLIEKCRVSVGSRTAYYRTLNVITETGRYDGGKALINMLYKHLDRTAATLYSPVELKFSIDFDRIYDKIEYQRAAVVAKQITRQWDRTNCDLTFGRGVFEALKYGACFLKQFVQSEGSKHGPHYHHKLVMPWQFGVYNEADNDLGNQSAMCESTVVTLPEVWRRIWHLPDAKKMFERVRAHASKGQATDQPQSFFHSLLSTSQLQTGADGGGATLPGGIMPLGADSSYSIMGPQLAVETVQMHELWVQTPEDYKTIIIVEPDVLITEHKLVNILGVATRHPYTLIQPNQVSNWLWGRSELVDIIEPQGLLSLYCDDAKRLMGLQVDKLVAFIGEWGLNDEVYGQFRNAGYVQGQQGSQVQDLTPKFPPELLPMIEFLIQTINTLSGFPEILQGKGEPGVRAGAHAESLIKTASPPLRDRALIVERQLAMAADLTFDIKKAKDDKRYWTNADNKLADIDKSSFLLEDLPNDWRVTVDSHSASPIFANESQQLIAGAFKLGVVDGEYFIDNMQLPNKDEARTRLQEKEKKQSEMFQQLLQVDPEIGRKMMEKQFAGKKR